jgi:predicted secreted protein
MGWFTAFVLYVLIWWTALFAVLPLGTRPQAEPDPLTGWRGAPDKPHLLRKLALTTLVTTVIWGIAVGLIESDWLSFRHGILKMPDDYTTR